MRFLPTRVHGVVDYLWGVSLMATPYVFGFATGGTAQWTAIAFGIGAILYSLLTDYEVGLVRLVPMPLHLGLDFLAGVALAASPWVLASPQRCSGRISCSGSSPSWRASSR